MNSAFTRTLARIREQVQSSQALIILAWIHHVGPMYLDELQYALAIEPHHTQFQEDNLPDGKNILDCCLGLVRLDLTKITLVHTTLSVFFDSCPAILQESAAMIANTCLTYLLFKKSERPSAISSLMNRVWLQLLYTTEDRIPKDKAWRYLKLMNKRMNKRRLTVSKYELPIHARALVNHKVPALSTGQRPNGQTLLHTACMLGLDSFDPILNRIAHDTTCSGTFSINSIDVLGISALGWTLLSARETDDSEASHARPSQQRSFEHNIYRAERIIRTFPDLDPGKPLWDINVLDMIDIKSGSDNQIENFPRLPFLFFLNNYNSAPEAIGRCMSLMESHLNFNLWSALQKSSRSDPTNKVIDAPAGHAMASQGDQRWILVSLGNEAERRREMVQNMSRREAKAKLDLHSSKNQWTDTSCPGMYPDEQGLIDKTFPSPGLVRKERVALFKPGIAIPALVEAEWNQDPVSTYCRTRADITETWNGPLDGKSYRILFIPHQALLHVGAAANSVRVVNLALSFIRVEPNLLDHKGTTAMQLALMLGSWRTAHFLSRHDGVDMGSPDDMGRSPLHLCAQRPNHHRNLIEVANLILRSCKSVLNLQDKVGKTALHYAVAAGNRRLVSLLLRHNRVGVNIQDSFGNTPLHTAILERDINICEIILEQSRGSPILLDNLRVAWALSMSAGANFVLPLLRFAQGLIKHHAIPNDQNPLLSPVTGSGRGLPQLVYMASQSPDFTANDLDFMLALESTTYADAASSTTGALVLGRGGVLVDPVDAARTIRKAMFKGAWSVAAYLLSQFTVNLDHLAKDGESALHLAVIYNASQAVQLLLSRPDIDANASNSEG